MFEPLQFYTGRDRQLYEVVVFTVDTNKVSGYLSAPKQSVSRGAASPQGQETHAARSLSVIVAKARGWQT